MTWRNDPFACPQDWERTEPYDHAGDVYIPDVASADGQAAMLELVEIIETFANKKVPPGLDWIDAAWFAEMVGEAMLEDGGLR